MQSKTKYKLIAIDSHYYYLQVTGGYYADMEADCQLFHVCVQVSEYEVRLDYDQSLRKISFYLIFSKVLKYEVPINLMKNRFDFKFTIIFKGISLFVYRTY